MPCWLTGYGIPTIASTPFEYLSQTFRKTSRKQTLFIFLKYELIDFNQSNQIKK